MQEVGSSGKLTGSYALDDATLARLRDPADMMLAEYIAFFRSINADACFASASNQDFALVPALKAFFCACVKQAVFDEARSRFADIDMLGAPPNTTHLANDFVAKLAAGLGLPVQSIGGAPSLTFIAPEYDGDVLPEYDGDVVPRIARGINHRMTRAYFNFHNIINDKWGDMDFYAQEMARGLASTFLQACFTSCATDFAVSIGLDFVPMCALNAIQRYSNAVDDAIMSIKFRTRTYSPEDAHRFPSKVYLGQGDPKHVSPLAVALALAVVALIVIAALAHRSLAKRLHKCGWRAVYLHGSQQWDAQRKIVGRGAASIGSPCSGAMYGTPSPCVDGQPLVWVNDRTGDKRTGVLSKAVLSHMCAR
jgi:hypothetical protein